MTGTVVWLTGLMRRRGLRLLGTAAGIALAVGLTAALGGFIAASQATMTTRATHTVAVDWQVEVQRGAVPAGVLTTLRGTPGTATVQTVHLTKTTGLEATAAGSTQTTGPGVVLGLPAGYRSAFPAQLRQLAGSPEGPQLAQQTAANLHVAPGDHVIIGRPGSPPATITIAGVVDLPQADTLFQHVGAAAQSQATAPPDNVVLLPEPTFTTLFHGADVTTQFHVRRNAPLPAAPADAYSRVLATAHHFEAQTAGGALVGDNLAAALDAARGDAAYAQMLFLFLGLPGAVLACLLTAAVVGAGASRRRSEQALLRTRGLSTRAVIRLALAETVLVAALGCLVGLLLASATLALAARTGPRAELTWLWSAAAVALGVVAATATTLTPAVRDLRARTVTQTTAVVGRRTRLPWWLRTGLDLALVVAAVIVFWASSADNYTLVLAPEGIPSIAVSYWAFLGPALLWLGAAGLLTRIILTLLAHARPALTTGLRPLTGPLAPSGAASLSRQRPALARASVLLALALSFAASTATFNATYAQQAEADAQLTNGADVTVTEPPGASVPASAAAPLERTPGVRRVEPLQHRFAYVGADLQDLYGVNPATIASVTALQDAYFTGGTAKQLMTRLQTDPTSVLVSAETVKDFQLSPGDTLRLRLPDAHGGAARLVPFHFAGIVNEFPTAPKDSFFVANAAYVAKATGNAAVSTFLIDTGGTNQAQVAAAVRREVGSAAAVTDLTEARGKVGSSLTSVNLQGLTRIELGYAIVLAVAAGALVLALGLAERRRSMAIMTLLGARRRQLRGLVIGESTVILAGGLLGGAAIGTVLSHMLVKVLTGVFDPPPSHIAVPWSYLTGTTLAVVVALVAAAASGARASTRPAVEELRDL
ncbi:putative ABC transport system permease protein [Phycicoccus badiiscoriae]|uniref:Putative ABC transport system permease protein n=1 Tax=Pedococcus badiiscoriae TaxID=642776 RepID=A0A852WEY8_9MICO|nr:FtsX-like permease family protein [Pedococcus badiiscoriae]NYG07339.1 putative ABC transport system permease protein [Pedococcus badiiscoriae]